MYEDSLGKETYHDLGFKSKQELDRAILKLIQVRSECESISEIIAIK